MGCTATCCASGHPSISEGVHARSPGPGRAVNQCIDRDQQPRQERGCNSSPAHSRSLPAGQPQGSLEAKEGGSRERRRSLTLATLPFFSRTLSFRTRKGFPSALVGPPTLAELEFARRTNREYGETPQESHLPARPVLHVSARSARQCTLLSVAQQSHPEGGSGQAQAEESD
jgi:hypothetical protein